MIRFLSIRHFAVIDALEIEFGPGLTVLTGETGAGKSILVEAVGLLIGGRASSDFVRTGEETAIIQAVFEAPEGQEHIVRREITAQGRSRAFIDDGLTTSAGLRETCSRWVELHGQHEHQRLLDPASHIDLLDDHANLAPLRSRVADGFAAYRDLASRLARLRSAERDSQARADLIAFQLAEIDRVGPQPGEDDELAAARTVLANADRLARLCGQSYMALYEGDQAVLAGLGGVWRQVDELASLDTRFAPYLEARDAIKSQLEDLAFFLRSYASGIDASPARLQEVEDRLAALERLKKKHGPSLTDVLRRQAELRAELDAIAGGGQRAAALEDDVARARSGYRQAAAALSAARRKAAPAFTRRLESLLADLAMERTRCEVRFADAAGEGPETGWSDRGTDEAEFYLSPNPGEELRPLARIASGGELSRLMLALKTLGAMDAPGRTLIFDEVDAGIGGRVAGVVGARLRELGERFQVLCITHLPQIAAHAGSQLRIAKSIHRGRTRTDVTAVSGEERVGEIARMLAGSGGSSAALATARAMLAGSEAKGEATTKGESERANTKRGERGRPVG
jgi:DNA repair protein RecN (Recombination protein N)